MATTPSDRFVSGFVSIVGRPNTGKSTLLNTLVGTKLAIVADKPQTTRTSIQGVLTLPNAQVVFLDTPGIHRSDTTFNKRMMESVRAALDGRDLLLFLVDATLPFQERDAEAVDMIRRVDTPVILLANKIDKLKDKSPLLPLFDRYRELYDFAEYLPISARTGEGLDELRSMLIERLPEGPQYFPSDYLTDQPERFLCAELIREKVLHETRQEVPHSAAVLIDYWEETPRLTRISATIYVEKEGQKAIVIGAKGAMLKKIGTAARQEMEALLGRKIFLELYVKVRPGWRENNEFLNELDWHTVAGIEAKEE
ncbi:MAG: GTPase Era [Bryobacteraceae bacterium]|nr:GTPase Era [Bryobacteraceae bacterium]